MAKGARKNQGRRVASPLAASDYTPPGMDKLANSAEGIKEQTEWYGKQRAQLVDIANQLESIFTLQQNQRREVDQMYGIEKKMLDNLGYMANQVKMIAIQKQLTRDLSLQESNILKTTLSDYESYNQEAAAVAKTTRELLSFRKQQVPFEEKIKRFTSEISSLQTIGVANLTTQEKTRLASLQTLEKQYKALSKQEQMNQRIEKAQASINDLMSGQHSAAGKIFDTLKDIVTNPLALFTGLLAVGLQRYEQMRQRGNELAEEMDRVNKKLAGAGPFQDKILAKASLIKRRFYEMGEGFSSSLEGAVDAIVALESQFGKVDYVSGKLVKTMAELKLSIGLSDDEAAKVLDNFSMIGGLTDEAAVNMTNLTYQMSEQAGLNPQEIFKDIAAASGDTLASFSGTSTELARSAVTARRLGLTLNDMAQVSSSLLDFETSIEKEMEAQLITGIDLNLQKARMLAMQGDEAGAMEEVMKQVGGLDRFNKMAPHQQRALAEAVGLTVGQLQKSSAQREREAKHAQMQHDLVTKQYKLAEAALPMLGKLDAGLGVMERIAKVIGDLFLDVFGVGIKDLEKTFFKFLESPAFKTGFKNMLFLIKGIVLGIKDAVVQVAGWIDSLSGGAIGGFLKDFSSKDFSGSYGKSEQIGKSIGKGVALMLGASKLLGATRLTAMWVRMSGGMGGLGELLGLGGSAGKFYKGGQYMPGGMRAPVGGMMAGGRTLMGMNLGAGLGGASGGVGTALGGTMLGTAGAALGAAGAIGSIGMGIYDVSQLDGKSTSRDKSTAKGGLGGAVGGAAAGALIGSVVPVIGTLLGAGIGGILGYFGGRSIGSMDGFRDDLDKSRDELAEAQEAQHVSLTAVTARIKLSALKNQNLMIGQFKSLSGGLNELTGDKLKKFGDQLLASGDVSKQVWRQFAKDGKLTMEEMRKLTEIRSNDITITGTQNVIKVRGQIEEEYSEPLKTIDDQMAAIQQMLDKNSGISQTIADRSSYPEFKGPNARFRTDDLSASKFFEKIMRDKAGVENIDFMVLQEIMKQSGSGTSGDIDLTTPKDVQTFLDKSLGAYFKILETEKNKININKNNDLTEKLDSIYTKTTEVPTADGKKITAGIDELTQVVDEKLSLSERIELLKDNEVIIDYDAFQQYQDRHFRSGLDRARGGVLAKGGITYGPSHAQGGIPTRYGELEGGEAVINKRSTAMYGGLLSQINQAGGGVTFGDGGVTGKRFAKGGITGEQRWLDEVNRRGSLKGKYAIGSSSARELSEIMGKTGEVFGFDYGDSLGKHKADESQLPGGKFYTSGANGAPGLTYTDAATINMMQAASRYPAGGGLWGGSLGRQAWLERDIPFDDGKGGRAWQGVKPFYYTAYKAGMDTGRPGAWAQTDQGRGYFGGTIEGTDQGKDRKFWGVPMFNSSGKRNSPEYIQDRIKALAGATGGRELAVGMLAALAAAAVVTAGVAVGTGLTSATTSAGGMAAGLNLGANSWGVVSGLAKAGLGAETIGSIAGVLYDVYHGKVGEGGALKYMSKALPKPINYIPKAFEAKNDLDKDPPDYLSLVTRFLPAEGINKVLKFGMNSWKAVDKKSFSIANSLMSNEQKEIFNKLGIGGKTTKMGQGGIIPNSPIKKVNDMILTKDGQMIETHADDNLIAKKGAITQTSSGGNSRVEELLLELIAVTRQSGNVYMDGAKVSAAINQVNYNA